MSAEQQRVAIAEACGWIQLEHGYWKDPNGHEWQVMHGWQTYQDGSNILPDYLNDLNAMHEAESHLGCVLDTDGDGELESDYERQLAQVMKPRGWRIYYATAAQRAEAFLRTIGKWEEARR